jgi:uncharacterized protein YjiS (DUF1127 family)
MSSQRLLPSIPVNKEHEQVTFDIRNILSKARTSYRRHQTRKVLAKLSLHHLEDIGITPEQREMEANKPFWK